MAALRRLRRPRTGSEHMSTVLPGLTSFTNPSPCVEEVACPKCGSGDKSCVLQGCDRLHHIPGKYSVSECRRCGLWFQNPRPVRSCLGDLYPADYQPHAPVSPQAASASPPPSTARYLRRRLGYEHLSPGENTGFDWRSWAVFEPIRKWSAGVNLVPSYAPDARLLEIGCGNGGRLLELRNLGWRRLYGIELQPRAAAIAEASGFSVQCGRIEDLLDAVPDAFFDVVVSSMVLEHLLNPFDTVRRLAAKIRPGGRFLFSTVTRDGLDARIYGTYWRNLDLPRHLTLFRRADIRDMLAGAFERVEMFYDAAAIDFVGSARFRRCECKRILDALLISLGEARVKYASIVLAFLGRTSRVSVRCVRTASDGF